MAGRLTPERQHEVARDAARLLRDGRAADPAEAVRAALRGAAGAEEVPIALVREHARGLAMETLGDVGYRHHVAQVLEQAEETMTLLVTLLATERGRPADEGDVVLVGRSVQGHIDADPCLRIRLRTDEPSGVIAALLVSAGVEEPSFDTVETRFGRLERLRFDDSGVETRIVRCPPRMRIPMDANLRASGSVPALALDGVRRMIALLRDAGEP